MNLTFHGASQTVTGSCILVETGKSRLLVDCGLQQDGLLQKRNGDFEFDPAALDAVLIAHGHVDRAGRIPLLIKNGYKGSIYAHYATCELARLLWRDTVKSSEHSPIPQLYNEQDVQQAEKQLVALAYGIPIEIKEVAIVFRDAGHVLGSSHIEISADGKRVLFSGDIGLNGTPIMRNPFTAWSNKFDAVVIESTYGNRNHKELAGTLDEFESIIKHIVFNRGVLLVPSFAIGPIQEILYYLNILIETGKIPPIPVIIDSPTGAQVKPLYMRCRDCYDAEMDERIESGNIPFDFRGLFSATSVEESNSIENLTPPFIVIAGSGMCSEGRIVQHLFNFAHLESTTIMFVEYQGKGSLGRKIIDGERNITINGKPLLIHARIKTLNRFSAHADQATLIDWAKQVPGENIQWYVNHGESEGASVLAVKLECKGFGKAVVSKNAITYEV